MPNRNLDFLVTAIDNFGDTGFALDLAESVLFDRPDWNVRFFSDDRALFDRLTDGRPHPKVSYFELSEYESRKPSAFVVSFFDRKLPEAHFAKFPHPKKIIQLSYLRFDTDVGSMNGTRYRLGRDEVIHLVPSPLESGAGVVVGGNKDAMKLARMARGHETIFEKDGIIRPSWTVSAFCYSETLSRIALIKDVAPIPFVLMWTGKSFLRFDEYAGILGHFSANVVRGENSAIKAMLSGKPFLWDFYKESNGAHTEKIEDFIEFVRPFFEDRKSFEKYATATRAFNAENFGTDEARACAEVLMTGSAPFERMSETVLGRDLTKGVLNEFEQ